MTTIEIRTQGEVFSANIIETVLETPDASAHIVDVQGDRFAAIVYRDGTIITSSDWAGTCGHDNPETVLAEIGDPTFARNWMRAHDLADCIVIDGLPRVLG